MFTYLTGLDDMDLTNYKEMFQKNREKFAAVKKKIQENMKAQFDDILKEVNPASLIFHNGIIHLLCGVYH